MFNLKPPPVLSRLADMARDVAGASLVIASEGLEDLACLVRGLPEAPVPPGWCDGCGMVREPVGELPPGWPDRPRPTPQASVLVERTTWVAGFAFEVEPGALLALDGPAGRRAMRVTRLLRTEHTHGFATVEWVTFLLADAESGEPGSLEVPVNAPLTVAAVVPDTVPAEFTGGVS